MTATDDPALTAISGQTFRLVRKGYDPEEVRAYLRRVDAAVSRFPSPDHTPAPAETAAAETVPAPGEATVATEPPADRWDALGQHVARILAQAETEAASMTDEARSRAAALAAEAEADRAAARDHLAQSELMGRSIVAEAETAAVAKRAEVEPQVREHIAATLAGAQSELDETRTALREARARLTEVHALVGRSLGEVGADPAFASPEEILNAPAGEPAGPSSD